MILEGVRTSSRVYTELATERALWPLLCSRLIKKLAIYLGPDDCTPFATAMCASLWSSLPGTERPTPDSYATFPSYTAAFTENVTAAQATAVLRGHLTLVQLYRDSKASVRTRGEQTDRGLFNAKKEALAALSLLSSPSAASSKQFLQSHPVLPPHQLGAVQAIDSTLLRFFDVSGAVPRFVATVRAEVDGATSKLGPISSSPNISNSTNDIGESDASEGDVEASVALAM